MRDIHSGERTILAAPRPDPEARLPDLTQPLAAADIIAMRAEMDYPDKALFVLETWCIKNPERQKPPPPREADGAWGIAILSVAAHATHTVLEAAERVERHDVIKALGRYTEQLGDRITQNMERCMTRNMLHRAVAGMLQVHKKKQGYNPEIATALRILGAIRLGAQRYLDDPKQPPSAALQTYYRNILDCLCRFAVRARANAGAFTAEEQHTVLGFLDVVMNDIRKNPRTFGHAAIIARLDEGATIQT